MSQTNPNPTTSAAPPRSAAELTGRRGFLGSASLGLIGLMASGSLLAGRQAGAHTPPPGIPSHLTSYDPNDPNAFIPWSLEVVRLLGRGDIDTLMTQFETLVDENAEALAQSQIVAILAQLDAQGNLPTTIQEMVGVFVQAVLAPPADDAIGQSSGVDGLSGGFNANAEPAEGGGLLCTLIAGTGCVDVGCSAHCDRIPRFGNGGECFEAGPLLEEWVGDQCGCVCNPPWWELLIIALILLLLLATPGPDEIPATIAALSRYLVRLAPALP